MSGSVAARPAATGPAGWSVSARAGVAEVAVRPGVQQVGRVQASPPTTADCEQLYKVACYVPGQIRRAYNIPALYEQGVTGRGTTIVIVDSFGSPTIRQDLAFFDKTFGLPAPPGFTIIRPAGTVPRYDPNNSDMVGWAGETTLDVEYAHVIAPGARILLAETPVSENEGTHGFPQIVAAETYVIRHHLGDVISQSFSATEQTFPSAAAVRALRGAYQLAARNRVTVLAASGDSGPADVKRDGTTYYPFPVTSWPGSDIDHDADDLRLVDAVDGAIREDVRPREARGRLVRELAFRMEVELAVRGTRDQLRPQGVAIGVVVVLEHARAVDLQLDALFGGVVVVDPDRRDVRHRQRDEGGDADGAVVREIGEAVDPGEAMVRLVIERPVVIEVQVAVSRALRHPGLQRVPVRVDVVGQHPGAIDMQLPVVHHRPRVGQGDRRDVDRQSEQGVEAPDGAGGDRRGPEGDSEGPGGDGKRCRRPGGADTHATRVSGSHRRAAASSPGSGGLASCSRPSRNALTNRSSSCVPAASSSRIRASRRSSALR